MSTPVMTVVDATVVPDREAELLAGYRLLEAPPGLLRSDLLRGQDGAWRIQTVWRDRDALMAVRNSGQPHAALALLEALGAKHSHAGFFTVEQSHQA